MDRVAWVYKRRWPGFRGPTELAARELAASTAERQPEGGELRVQPRVHRPRKDVWPGGQSGKGEGMA
eukprot:360440-Chlamydomonas_euryale.AAC.1